MLHLSRRLTGALRWLSFSPPRRELLTQLPPLDARRWLEQQINAARAADAQEASRRQNLADERTSLLRSEMEELQQRAEAFAQHEMRARDAHLGVLRECELQAEHDRLQVDELRQQERTQAQERHELILSQQRLVIEHEAAQAFGEAAAAQVRVQQLVAEESLQQGATLFWRSKDEHASEQRQLAARAEMALQNLRAEADEQLQQQELQLRQWQHQVIGAARCRPGGREAVRKGCR